MKAWGLTDVGNVREVNQDTFRMKRADGEEAGLFLVCDGMGGAKAGEVASRLAAEAFLEFMDGKWSEGCTEEQLRESYDRVNETVYDMAQSDPDYAGMGTTMVTAVCTEGRVLVGNVGDSRAYLLDENGARQITEDHSLVSELMKRGDLTPY